MNWEYNYGVYRIKSNITNQKLQVIIISKLTWPNRLGQENSLSSFPEINLHEKLRIFSMLLGSFCVLYHIVCFQVSITRPATCLLCWKSNPPTSPPVFMKKEQRMTLALEIRHVFINSVSRIIF